MANTDSRSLLYWSYGITALALLIVLKFHLLGGLIAGLLVYELVQLISPWLLERIIGRRSRLFAVATLAVATVGVLIFSIAGTIAFFRGETGGPQLLEEKLEHIINDARTRSPEWLVNSVPADVDELKTTVHEWFTAHSKDIQHTGKQATEQLVRIIIGMVVGALLSLHELQPEHLRRPFATLLLERVNKFAEAFRRILFAQFWISAINSCLTAIFILLILPLFGIRLPLAKTLIAITFITGLIPIIGNILSNTIITVVALSVSLLAAVAALIFLLVIHKMEYFLNARIVGTSIRAHAWELLIVMISMEAMFGLAGLVAAPFFYAYVKRELSDLELI